MVVVDFSMPPREMNVDVARSCTPATKYLGAPLGFEWSGVEW